MLLYHGSNCAVTAVDLNKCRPFKDFGRGFYTTELKDQALQMAARTARIFGGSPVLNEFTLDDAIFTNDGVRVKRFSEPDTDWAAFVINNRNRGLREPAGLDCNLDNKYDVVIGPVADDDIRVTLELYLDGRLSESGILEALRSRKLTQQISFHSEKSLSFLSRNL